MKSPFFIAEISANHNGSISKLKKLIKSAKKNGADAVKLQTYTADMMTLNTKNKKFLIKEGIWKNKYLWDLYDNCKTPLSWHKEIFDFAAKEKIICFSSPFSIEAVDFLEKFNPKFYKIASFEITDLPLIKRVAQTKKHLIISTGMANLSEISAAFNCAKKNGAKKITLLYCVSNYPANIEDFNLNNISFFKKKFNCSVGLSDHCNNPKLAFAAILAGAEFIEKHIALPGDTTAPDYKFSIKDKEILKYRKSIDEAHRLLGKKYFFINNSSIKNKIFRRSIYAIKNINIGEKITEDNIKILRPNYGLDPKFYYKILNTKCTKIIKANTPFPKSYFSIKKRDR